MIYRVHGKVGIIGLSTGGWASTHHAPALPDTYKLVALSTSSADSAAAAGKKYGVKAYYGDPAQLARDTNVDLVVVSVKVPHHKEAVWPAIEAGKDVFVEWPLARDLEEAREIERFAREKGVRTMVGLQARQVNAVRKAKALVESGKIGKVLSTSVVGSGVIWGATTSERYAYLRDNKNGASMLTIPTSHALDGLSYVLGDFASLSATTAIERPTVSVLGTDKTIEQTTADHIAIHGILQSGALASVLFRGGLGAGGEYAKRGSLDFFWEIEGEDGIIVLKGLSGSIQVHEPTLYLNGEKVNVGEVDPLGPTRREYEEFAKGSEGEYLDFAYAVKRHEVIEAIERSAREGTTTTYL
ncbi:hypothetical protein PLICRDRAFT_37140 [Plicaturopsis crispa FD-325 SS-3]|nr:hypothetical protein PLICRDRAFT_37140 [Plicaturopsis crispa FD-325 SS-3]